MFDGVAEPGNPEMEMKNSRGQVVEVFGAEYWDERLVIGLDQEGSPQYVVGELAACPGHRQSLFLNLSVPFFRIG